VKKQEPAKGCGLRTSEGRPAVLAMPRSRIPRPPGQRRGGLFERSLARDSRRLMRTTLSEQGGQCWNWRDHRIERQGGCGHQGKARGEVNALPGEKPHAVTTAHGDDPLPAPAGWAGYARTPLPWIPHRPNRGQGARCRTEASKLPVRGARVKLASSTARSCGHPG
jgi:hypothetical protein